VIGRPGRFSGFLVAKAANHTSDLRTSRQQGQAIIAYFGNYRVGRGGVAANGSADRPGQHREWKSEWESASLLPRRYNRNGRAPGRISKTREKEFGCRGRQGGDLGLAAKAPQSAKLPPCRGLAKIVMTRPASAVRRHLYALSCVQLVALAIWTFEYWHTFVGPNARMQEDSGQYATGGMLTQVEALVVGLGVFLPATLAGSLVRAVFGSPRWGGVPVRVFCRCRVCCHPIRCSDHGIDDSFRAPDFGRLQSFRRVSRSSAFLVLALYYSGTRQESFIQGSGGHTTAACVKLNV